MFDNMLSEKQNELRQAISVIERRLPAEHKARQEFESVLRRYHAISRDIEETKDSNVQVDRYDLMLRAEGLMSDLRNLHQA